MQFLRNARAFGESFFKAYIHLFCQSQHTEPKERQNHEPNHQYASEAKPPCLPEHRLDLEFEYGFRAIPYAVAVAGYHAKTIRARIKIGVHGLTPSGRFAPPSIEPVDPELQSYPARSPKTLPNK